MIRFINIGEQICDGGSDFAWWDTVTDEFIRIYGETVWESWSDFEGDYSYASNCDIPIERFRKLYNGVGE